MKQLALIITISLAISLLMCYGAMLVAESIARGQQAQRENVVLTEPGP